MIIWYILISIVTVVGWILTFYINHKITSNNLIQLTKLVDNYIVRSDKNFDKIWDKIDDLIKEVGRLGGTVNGKSKQ